MSESISCEEACQILQVGEDSTPTEVLNLFKCAYDSASSREDKEQLIESKEVIIQNLICQQIKEQRFFEIISPFETSCIICRGAGSTFKFIRKVVEVNCHICAGKGKRQSKIKVECKKCKGTGRYKKRWRDGGGINVTCKFCKGEGHTNEERTVNCKKCAGKGKIPKFVLSDKIESTTPCNRCKQKGFIDEQPKKKKKRHQNHISNPVITGDLAAKIRETIPDNNLP